MPQMMANAMPAAVPVMHGTSRGNMYKYPPMSMHNSQQQQQQQHAYQQQTVQQHVPPSTVAMQPVLGRQLLTVILDIVDQHTVHTELN